MVLLTCVPLALCRPVLLLLLLLVSPQSAGGLCDDAGGPQPAGENEIPVVVVVL